MDPVDLIMFILNFVLTLPVTIAIMSLFFYQLSIATKNLTSIETYLRKRFYRAAKRRGDVRLNNSYCIFYHLSNCGTRSTTIGLTTLVGEKISNKWWANTFTNGLRQNPCPWWAGTIGRRAHRRKERLATPVQEPYDDKFYAHSVRSGGWRCKSLKAAEHSHWSQRLAKRNAV